MDLPTATGPGTATAAPALPPVADPAGPAQTSGRSTVRRLLTRPEIGGAVSALALFVFFSIFAGDNGFLTQGGTANWVNAAAELGIVAVPIGLLMIAGEFDLSVGAMVGVGSMSVGITTGGYGEPAWLGVIVGFAIAVAVGVANGFMVVRTGLPSFIVTLATMMMLLGGALAVSIWATGSSNVSASSSGLTHALFASKWMNDQLGVALVWWVLLLVVSAWMMSRTRFGNWTYATGGNVVAARLVGVPTDRVKISLFVATSVCAVLTGTVQTLTLGNGNVTLGSAFIFQAVAAAVIGGVLLTGGYGSPMGTACGAATYGIISTGVLLLGWNADLTQLFIGALLLVAVLANHRLRALALSGS
ncbi:simple sugar transport system permease protein [Motilibacter peucedani]|uniref:Xylose transport system permease protein XylH n=1 Tax=Motilibacter peucedani TaxID=598650 RepID=A0A420XQP6_9ACTN|nr:ABC transporter permease [Motilibacter peucedani]RKS75536.1 simple sugar transport system permease protein [Motilibacter peucedani]